MSGTPPLFLSRARLRREGGVRALLPLLRPEDGGGAAALAGHRLVWSLLADGPERRRDFLWRETEPGTFLILGPRPPVDAHGLFELDPPKPFAPALPAGRRLRFDLRANATVSAARGADRRGKREGLLASRLRAVPPPERRQAARRAAFEWLAAQGARHGFAVDPERFALRAEDTWQLPRGPGAPPASVAVMDVAGEIEVRDGAALLARLAAGFGHARGFGCGLMLLAPAG